MWLIDADVFLLELTHWKGTDGNYHENSQTFYTLDEVMDAIEEADVEAEPVKRGWWIKTEDGRWYCSECKKEDYYAFLWDATEARYELQDNYCPNCGANNYHPNCGARMEEET